MQAGYKQSKNPLLSITIISSSFHSFISINSSISGFYNIIGDGICKACINIAHQIYHFPSIHSFIYSLPFPSLSVLSFYSLFSVLIGPEGTSAHIFIMIFPFLAIQLFSSICLGAICPDSTTVNAKMNFWQDPTAANLDTAFYRCKAGYCCTTTSSVVTIINNNNNSTNTSIQVITTSNDVEDRGNYVQFKLIYFNFAHLHQ